MEMLKKIWASEKRVPFACGILAFLPVLASLPAGIMGIMLGCNMNEGGTDPCVRFGIGFGEFLNPFSVLPWLCMITMPVAFGILAVWWIWKQFHKVLER